MTTHRLCHNVYSCPMVPKCDALYNCYFKAPAPETFERDDTLITMLTKPFEWLGDLLRTFVYWAWTIALVILIMVAAGVAFGFIN